ncbi:monocarboxylate transporter 13-like [Acanthaster planci]|uniref:Monocarboxylate transporter 13-like n=1 Tax=Acanthaster planci TaxID=133434 RepID=A0A8B7Z7S4_ACAPL|nr:monocarboxylate transporter 13-like [Acanthaster planci]XP_022101710.1 monocarboxylate transporter 13-like [Acanthaster planci]XP_022101711.1 monocarboxylate transporter 13-like [Acanthaster planci]
MACCQSHCWWWRWVVTLAAFNMIFLSLGPQYNYSILYVSLQAEFHSGSALTGWIGSLAGALSCLCSPFTVLLERKLSKRAVVNLGIVLFCAGLMTTSFVPAVGYAYLTFGVLAGVGSNLMCHSSVALVLDWFVGKNFYRASVFTVLGSTCGMLVFSPVVTICITHYGWRDALRILSGGILAAGLASSAFLTNPPTEDYAAAADESLEKKQEMETMVPAKKDPEGCTKGKNSGECGSKDNETNEKEENIEEAEGNTVSNPGFFVLIKSIEVWLWFIGSVLAYTGWTFFNINFASFMEGLGFSSSQVASVIMFFACGEIGGKILIGVTGDRLPFLRVYLIFTSCSLGAVLLGLLTIVETLTSVVIVAVLSGVLRSGLYGATIAAGEQLFYQTFGANTVMVLSFVPSGVGTLISAPLSGVLYDSTGNYTLGILVIAVLFVCASATFAAIPVHRKCRSRGRCGRAACSDIA